MRIITILLLLIPALLVSCITVEPYNLQEERVFEFPDIDKATLLSYTREFLTVYIVDRKLADDFIDEERGKVVGDFYTTTYETEIDMFGRSIVLTVNYNISVKDGAAKLILSSKDTLLVKTDIYGQELSKKHYKGYAGTAADIEKQKIGLKEAYADFFDSYGSYVREILKSKF